MFVLKTFYISQKLVNFFSIYKNCLVVYNLSFHIGANVNFCKIMLDNPYGHNYAQ